MTPSLSIDQNQIADLIATKLSADPTFRAALATALARQSYEQADSQLRLAVTDANIEAKAKLQTHLSEYAETLKADGKASIRKRFEELLRGPLAVISDEWLKGQAKAAIGELMRETFGRRAHHFANECIQAGSSKIDLLFSSESK